MIGSGTIKLEVLMPTIILDDAEYPTLSIKDDDNALIVALQV